MMPNLLDNFDGDLSQWQVAQVGRGTVTQGDGTLTMALPGDGDGASYHNAQITDYRYHDMRFRWTPPLRMTVTARATAGADSLRGTAGFGFWNHPFSPDTRRVRLPRALWFFFSSPPNNMQLAHGVPGSGWKVQTMDAQRAAFLALLPAAPLGFMLMRVPAVYNRLWRIAQRAIGVSETLLDGDLLQETHTYALDWRKDSVTFWVDNAVVHEAPSSPGAPLGFIAWMDNQYAIVTPQGHFGAGVVPVEQKQALELSQVAIEKA